MTNRKLPEFIRAHAAFVSVVAQFILAILVLWKADLLTPGFRRILVLAVGGFVLNHLAPGRYRMRVFATLGLAALVLTFGWSASDTFSISLALSRTVPALLVMGAIAGACLVPVGFWIRVAMVAAVGTVVALLRIGTFGPADLSLLWPVVAGLCMFRLIVFLYHTANSKSRPGLAETISYFALFPNIAVGLFPVVDFKTFLRSHYDSEAIAIYQRGMTWIVRGITQLIVYRVIRQLWALPVSGIHDGSTLVQYLLTNSFLYLNVSGQFHLFIGLLLLFGFNLPETNRRYFLASSFTDYWRRVNIYWKDFILTVFYYPAYFRLKKYGATTALIAATAWCFFVTWALHLYQTWWLTGSPSMTVQDALFWGVLGLLVIVNSLWEMKHGRQRRLSGAYSARTAAGIALRTALTFSGVSVLWSLWSAPGVSEWMAMWQFADAWTAVYTVLVMAVVMAATILFEVLPYNLSKRTQPAWSPVALFTMSRPALQAMATLVAIYAAHTMTLQARIATRDTQPVIDAINAGTSVNDPFIDSNAGYYERLTKADSGSTQLWEAINGRALPYRYAGPDPATRVKNFLLFTLPPNVDMAAYDTHLRTNRWGMRDQDYEQAKPIRTFRIAVIGPSNAMGWAIEQQQVFESILEDRLNTERPAGDDLRFEVLNFSVQGRSIVGEAQAVEELVAPFQPDAVLLFAHSVDPVWVTWDLTRSLREHFSIPGQLPQQILEEARITGRTPDPIASERLRPFREELLGWAYSLVGERIRHLGAVPIAAYVPIPDDLPPFRRTAIDTTKSTALIREAGFHLLNFTSLFDNVRREDLVAPEPLRHLSAHAHRMLADAIYTAFVNDQRLLLMDRARGLEHTQLGSDRDTSVRPGTVGHERGMP